MHTPLVLLVEDDLLHVELALHAFREVDMPGEVRVAACGSEALDYLSGRGEFMDRERHPLPDLVVLDLKLPDMDGVDVLRSARASPQARKVPIVILSSSNESSDRDKCRLAGANDYLVKPTSYEAFLSLMREARETWFGLDGKVPLRESR